MKYRVWDKVKRKFADNIVLDKDKNEIQLIGYVKKNTDQIYECEKCPNVAFYESELEDIAEWVEEK